MDAMIASIHSVVGLEDPIGEVIEKWERPNGLLISKVSVPLGVIGIIYESRPNVTSDAAVLCLKSGNAVILRGGSESINTNIAIHESISDALIMNNWANYAKLIGDLSYKDLFSDFIHSDYVVKEMFNQLEFRRKEFS